MDKRFAQKYRDPRWQKRRLEVLQAADFACVSCGDSKTELHVHHSFYRSGLDPWQYPDEGLVCLCAPCHKEAEKARRRLCELLSRTGSRASVSRIIGYIIGLSLDGAELFGNIEDAEEAEGFADATCHYCTLDEAVQFYTTCAPRDPSASEIAVLKDSVKFRQRIFSRMNSNAKAGEHASA